MVALRKESVDRNSVYNIVSASIKVSLSARRAWIEIVKLFWQNYECFEVALRKESVDRNLKVTTLSETIPRSLSARRAWIEIAQNRRV